MPKGTTMTISDQSGSALWSWDKSQLPLVMERKGWNPENMGSVGKVGSGWGRGC